ncbi:unnamed protein product [Coffea canephora]|uniref:Uncharacterized protein n=1 Tax=Coffea canephora TaxID=49390 RepID=A0A068V4V6_COFCA|nr:unnamed protein product [Coffea canephora]
MILIHSPGNLSSYPNRIQEEEKIDLCNSAQEKTFVMFSLLLPHEKKKAKTTRSAYLKQKQRANNPSRI